MKQQTLLCRKTGAILQKTDDPLQNTSVPLQPCSGQHPCRWQVADPAEHGFGDRYGQRSDMAQGGLQGRSA